MHGNKRKTYNFVICINVYVQKHLNTYTEGEFKCSQYIPTPLTTVEKCVMTFVLQIHFKYFLLCHSFIKFPSHQIFTLLSLFKK